MMVCCSYWAQATQIKISGQAEASIIMVHACDDIHSNKVVKQLLLLGMHTGKLNLKLVPLSRAEQVGQFNIIGTDSSSTVPFRIFISQIRTASPPPFRCSAIKPSGPGAFLFFSLATALETSSAVKGSLVPRPLPRFQWCTQKRGRALEAKSRER